MNADEFIANVESGELPVRSHDQVLRIAYIYTNEGLWSNEHGVFDVVDQLHKQGWSFGQGDLRFNRTVDIFYLAQIAAGIYRSTNQLAVDAEWPTADDFDRFYDDHRQLLRETAWNDYYSQDFLAQPSSARFYRLPNLQDLPDSDDALAVPRHKGRHHSHATKLPRWANTIANTHRRQLTLPKTIAIDLALSTLQGTIARLQKDHPHVQPYSETQARFWLNMTGIDSTEPAGKDAWALGNHGVLTAQGWLDMWTWQAHYSRERWESFEARVILLEPDLDGTKKSEAHCYGWPDGGVGVQALQRGWEPELGSEEEIAFLAAVAVRETKDVELDELDYAMRSHMLLGVLSAAFEAEHGPRVEELKRRFVEAGRLDKDNTEPWIQEAAAVMEPYARNCNGWPSNESARSTLLRQMLMENGQLFGRWKVYSDEFSFELKPKAVAHTTLRTMEQDAASRVQNTLALCSFFINTRLVLVIAVKPIHQTPSIPTHAHVPNA